MRRWGRAVGDRGDTLLEVLVAVVIMGIAITAIVGGYATTIRMSDTHRKQTTAGTTVRDYAEAIANWVATGNYTECATNSTYSPTNIGYTGVPTGYIASVTGVQFWTGSAFASSCQNNGVERLTLTVGSSDHRASESLSIVVRKPCGTRDAAC